MQFFGTHPRSISDSQILGIPGSVQFPDPNLGDSNSPSDLDMGSEHMIRNLKDSRLGDGFLNFIVVCLITGRDSRIDDKLWQYLVFSSMT